ncbi:MAG: nucleotide pyrophosphohydrolase [Clostridia bacterium]|nr:nucleotide pyrophosphohydrolase [Clostridia bacterium]
MEITIDVLEKYLLERYGGWANEQGLFLKLVEEIGEVAEVINMKSGSKKAMDVDLQKELGTELADMIHYIVAIAAINHIDLTSIMLEKDKKASIKYNHSINLETFISAKHDE